MSDQNPNPLHEDFINSAPEELREAAAELAPVWDQYVQGKFTEAADFRKQFEPFAELPLDQVTPDDIKDYLEFKQIQSDPQQLKQWHEQWEATIRAEHPGLFEDEEFEGGADPALLAKLHQTEQQLNEVIQWRQGIEQQQQAEQATAYVNSQIEDIKKDYPSLTDEDVDSICTLAIKYVPQDGTQPPEDFIKQGFKDFQRIVGQTERNLFAAKESQPAPSMSGGRPATGPQPITTFDGANEAARRAVIESMRR